MTTPVLARGREVDLARLAYEAAVLGETLRILEQARHRVLAVAPSTTEYGTVVADRVAEGTDHVSQQLVQVWHAKDRLSVRLDATLDDDSAPRLVLAVDLAGWQEGLERLRAANRAALAVPLDVSSCEGWCREACPESELTRVEAGEHAVLLCPKCLARLEGREWPPKAIEAPNGAARKRRTNGNGG